MTFVFICITSHPQLLYTGPQLSLFARLSFVSQALYYRLLIVSFDLFDFFDTGLVKMKDLLWRLALWFVAAAS